MASASAGESERAHQQQRVRLIEQAVFWRTLVETNRDVFLAENLLRLAEERFPEQRILVLAHRSHTERIRNRMGQFLAESLGTDYLTVTLGAVSGEHHYWSSFRDQGFDAPLERLPIDPARHGGPMADLLREASEGRDLLFHVWEARESDTWRDRLQKQLPPKELGPEILILLGGVVGIEE